MPAPAALASSTEATREKLILAAEELFAEFGVDAVALRSVCVAARQRNTSSVHYHFGDKDALLAAIFEYREQQLEPLRRRLLEQAKSQDRLTDIRMLLRVIYQPYVQLLMDSGGICYLKLTSFYVNHLRPRGTPHPVDLDHPCTASARETVAMVKARMTHLSARQIDQRLQGVSALFLSTFIQNSTRDADHRAAYEALFEDTLEMMAAALAALPYPS